MATPAPQWPQGDYASSPTFAVSRALASACLPLIAGVARELGTPRSGVAALLLAWRRPMALGELARLLGRTPSTMTSVVADLVAAGLATRDPDPADGRRALVSGTPAARDALCGSLRTLEVQLDDVDRRFEQHGAQVGRAFITRAAQAVEAAYGLPQCGPMDADATHATLITVVRYAAMVTPMLAVLAQSLEISRTEMKAALVITEQSSGPGDVALRLGLTPSAGSQVVEHLVERGLATRTPDPADRRRVAIALTEQFLTTMAAQTLPLQHEIATLDAAWPETDRTTGRAFMAAATTAVRHIYG